jgi:TolA-binding protein
MNLKKFLSISLVAVLIVGVAAFAIPGGSAAAQSPTPQPNSVPQARINLLNARLERMLRAEQATLERMTRHFDRLDRFITRVDTLIEKAKANGKDVSALEAALSDFQAKEGDARVVFNAASSLLAAHAGFDANGKVTDRAKARTTLDDAHAKFQDIRAIILDAARNLHDALKAWREANPPATTS